ncbi:hypothetical protein DFS33DRAFT_1449214 [Desarmillaria ectypa]|nr:hypothetical protein DFS33DRAFT_1449214 [Desarmillaria ectypa]
MTRLIGRSWCRLTTLAFSQSAVPSDVLYISDQTPTLEEVELVDVGSEAITDELLATLMYREGAHKHLLPRLRSLYLRGSFTFAMVMYASMVESRCKCTEGLELDVKLQPVFGSEGDDEGDEEEEVNKFPSQDSNWNRKAAFFLQSSPPPRKLRRYSATAAVFIENTLFCALYSIPQ